MGGAVAVLVCAIGPLVAMAADAANPYGAAGDVAKKVLDWGSIMVGAGASAVPVFTILENFLMNSPLMADPRVKVAANITISLLGWFVPGLAAGIDPHSLAWGALATSGGMSLYHDLMDKLGAWGKPLDLALHFFKTAGALGPLTVEQVRGLRAKGSPLAAHYNDDGSVKV